jgi:hypothetical protein
VNSSTPAPEVSLDELLRLRDERGVLSVYVGVDPSADSRRRHPWEIELENGLRSIRKQVREDGDHAQRVAVEERLGALAPVLADLVDVTEGGRGRALFAGIASGELRTVAVRVELPTEVVLGEVAHVIPLLRADDGHPRVIVLVGYNAVRVLEARFGRVDEVKSFDIEPVVYGDRELKAPAPAIPGRGPQGVNQRERWDRHVEAEHHRRLNAVSAELGRLAKQRKWAIGVVAGDPRTAEPLQDALERAGVSSKLVERDLVDFAPTRALAELAALLDEAVERSNLELVRRALDAAAAGGRGAVGLDAVLDALNEALVDSLLLETGRELAGAVASDGTLVPPNAGDALDPQFVDRVVLRAHETGARTAVVGGAAAEALADVGGVAAILRA